MCRLVVSPVFIILFLDLFVANDTASIPRGARSATDGRLSAKKLKEISYQINPREMIKMVFQVDTQEAYAIFHEAYNKNRDKQLPLIVTEIELDELSSATSQTMCKKPLPKIVNLYELLDTGHNVVLSPAGIAVNKCSQDSGCCPSGEECVGSEFSTRNFTYLHVENEVLTVQSHHVLEDARCHCRPIASYEFDRSQISGHYSSVQHSEELCDENHEYNEATGMCQCFRRFCASGTVLNDSSCQCEDATDEESEPDGNEDIICPAGKYFDAESGRCECSLPCPTGTTMDPLNCACEDSRRTLSSSLCGFTRCPKPFHINETACTCECDEGDKNCYKMRIGRKELNEKHCLNVRLGIYGTPTCIEGMFFNSTGVCICEDLL